MSWDYSDNLDKSSSEKYQLKLTASGLTECPYKRPAETWYNNPKKWPDVHYSDVHSYLTDSPGMFTREAMKNYKSLEAYKYFVSGWVQTVYHMKTDSRKSILMKAGVRPSEGKNDPLYHPWFTCKKNGTIITAHCDCLAGLEETCSHIAALLFMVEAAVRHGYTTDEKLCTSNKDCKKKVQASRIADIKFYKASVTERYKGKEDEEIPPSTPAEQREFLDRLAQCSRPPVVLSTFNEYYKLFMQKQEDLDPSN